MCVLGSVILTELIPFNKSRNYKVEKENFRIAEQ